MPSCSAARITSVPLGTVISNPSMVTVTPSAGLATAAVAGAGDRAGLRSGLVRLHLLVRRHGHQADSMANSVDAAGSNGQPPCRWCSRYSSLK